MDANHALPPENKKKIKKNLDLQRENIQCYFAKTLLWSSLAAPLEMGHSSVVKKVGIITSLRDERLTPGARGGPASKGLLVSFSNWAEAKHS